MKGILGKKVGMTQIFTEEGVANFQYLAGKSHCS